MIEGVSWATRLPYPVLANILYYLPKCSDLLSCMLTCRSWYAYLAHEDCDIWHILCEEILPQAALNDCYLLAGVTTYKAKLRAFAYAWNPQDCSRNVYIKLNGFTLHRNPIAQSTDGARGKMGFNSGRHLWEVWWDGPLGTVAVVGVATKHAAIQCHAYQALLGSDDQGWGWNLVDNSLVHNGRVKEVYHLLNYPPKYQESYGGQDKLITSVMDDQELRKLTNEFASLTTRRRNAMLLPFSYWGEPKPRPPKHVYELRTYTLKPGTMIEWGNNWARGINYRRDFNQDVAGFFSQIGRLYMVFHFWAYDDLATRKKIREETWRKPGWDVNVAYTVPLIRNMDSKIMLPTNYSQLQ